MPIPDNDFGIKAATLDSVVTEFGLGTSSAQESRACRALNGIYEQRRAGTFMLRIGIPAGRIHTQQLRALAALTAEYDGARLHLTTRQNFQIHDLTLAVAVRLSSQVLGVGFTSYGTGGNTVRNVVADPLSGLLADDAFDVQPYALAIASRYHGLGGSLNLPRKFKLAFSASDSDRAGAVAADLGFVARRRAGALGFQVFVAGGLGSKPVLGLELFPWLEAHAVGGVIEGVLAMFGRHGHASNRHRARLRHLRDRLGESEFRTLCLAAISKASSSVGVPTLTAREIGSESLPTPPSGLSEQWQSHPAILAEREQGRFSVKLSPPRGRLSPAALLAIADAAERLSSSTVRVGLEKELWLTGVGGQAIDELRERLRGLELGIPGDFELPIVACLGAETCRLGTLRSGDLPAAIGDRLRAAGVLWSGGTIRISGCPNGCGRHLAAQLGFEGRVTRVHGRLLPVYSVFAGGAGQAGHARLGTSVGAIPARRVPELVLELQRQQFKLSQHDDDTQMLRLHALVETLGQLPPDPSEDYFRDWGSDSQFQARVEDSAPCVDGPP